MNEVAHRETISRRPPPVYGLQLPSLAFGEEAAANWKLFRRIWSNYLTLCQLDDQPEPYRVALFLSCLDDDAMRLYEGLDFASDEDDRKVSEILEKFEAFAIGRTNETYERALFKKRSQNEGESFDNFLAALRSQIKVCGYCDKCMNSLLRDRIVVGIRDSNTYAELVKHRSLSLEKCIDVCRTEDKATHESTVLRSPAEVHAVKKPIRVSQDHKSCECKY